MDRKKFINQTSLVTLALLTQQVQSWAGKINYVLSSNISNSDDVIYFEKNNPQYDELRKGFNKRINNYPAIIALCNNTKGVQEAIQKAILMGLKVTVKSGGHCMEGLSSLNDGMVINLSMLNGISINGNIATIQPACLLKKIYETLLPIGLYLPGGSCQTVAIGGLTLGGGYGLMSRAYGLTADSLLEATMVNAKGEIVKTKNNDELLWALKGGGNGNFGVVTELVFKTIKAPTTLQSFKFRHQQVSQTKALEICNTWFTLSKTLPNNCFSAFIYNGRTTYILLTTTLKNTHSIQSFIDIFTNLSTKVTLGNKLPLAQALKAYYAEANPITFKNASAGLYKSYGEIEKTLPGVFGVIAKNPGILYQINTLGGAIQNVQFEQQSSFPHRACFYFSELQAYWDNPKSIKLLAPFEAIQEQFANAGVNAQYRNYPDINFKNWATDYYGKSLPRLMAIKKLHDPNNLFGGEQTLKANDTFRLY